MQITPISINNYSSQKFSTPSFQGLTVGKDALKTLGYESKKVLLNEVPTLKTLSQKANVSISRVKERAFDDLQVQNAKKPIACGILTTLLGAITIANSPLIGGTLFAVGLGGTAWGFNKLAMPNYKVNVEINNF